MGRITFALLVIISFSLLTCGNNGTAPPTDGVLPGKRDYVWNIDTIAYPGSYQTNMQSMWAASANNIYIVGRNDQNRGKMYHYDGVRWTPVHLTATDGGTISGPIDLSAIYGLSDSSIWAVGDRL